MVLHVLRALFVLLMAAIGWYFIHINPDALGPIAPYAWLVMAMTLTIGVLVICVDILSPRRKLAIFSGTFLGLIVGLLIAYGFSFVVTLVVDRFFPNLTDGQRSLVNRYADLSIGAIFSYLAISFILQTKDDFRFIIPYIEFDNKSKGPRNILVDTSVLIDGRIADIAQTGILESQLIIPRFVLTELQAVADSADKLKRNRGRRGLEVLQKLQSNRRAQVILYDSSVRKREGADDEPVDQQLMTLAEELNCRLLTNDFNLNQVATLRGLEIINLNELANALKQVVLPGERMSVRVMRAGEGPGQGVGFLDDGTMVVVEHGRPHVGDQIEFTVTSVLQTNAGKMVFGRLTEADKKPA